MLSGSTPLPEKLGLGGFSFDLARRNAVLEVRGMVAPKPKKTGTTIVGVIFDGGVVLGADTRATEGDTVADKNCEKIHYIADNIWCCGAGTSADTESTTGLIASQLELHRMATGKQPRVVTACTMLKRMLYRYQGHVSAALVLGGVDCNGPHLYTVYPHGSTDSLPYVTMGSGSLAAMAVFESEFKSKMTEEEAKKLVRCPPPRHLRWASCLPSSLPSTPFAPSPSPISPSRATFSSCLAPLPSPTCPSVPRPLQVHAAIMAGINNDLGSGGSVDLMVIDKDGNHPLRNYDRPNERALRSPPPPLRPHPPSPHAAPPRAHTAAAAAAARDSPSRNLGRRRASVVCAQASTARRAATSSRAARPRCSPRSSGPSARSSPSRPHRCPQPCRSGRAEDCDACARLSGAGERGRVRRRREGALG